MSETNMPVLSLCIDEYLEGTEFDEQELPSPIDPRGTSREELALEKQKLWELGQRLRIRFLDGDKALHQEVEKVARTWLEYANLEFEFGKYADAEIRVTFQGSGYRSLVGTDALQRPAPQPTMILGGLSQFTNPVELKRTVLHEFGHAIGCVHEQASPAINIPWDKEKVYAWYWSYAGWDRAKVDRNVFLRYGQSEVRYTAQHDPQSIMQYPVAKELTLGGFEIGWNNDLSEMDKMFIACIYPKSQAGRGAPGSPTQRGQDA